MTTLAGWCPKPAPKRAATARIDEVAPAPSAKAAVVTLKQLAAQFRRQPRDAGQTGVAMLDGVLCLIVDHLKAGKKLRLIGLGILEVEDRPVRAGRNPATVEGVQIAGSKKIAFRPAKQLEKVIRSAKEPRLASRES